MRHVIKYSLFCMFAVAVSVAQVPTAGLAAWYPFNGNANDSTGHALNDGKLFVTNPTPFVAGRNGSGLACNLDGVDDFILIPNKSSFNLPRDSAVISGWYDADACSKITADPRYLWDAYELSNTGERREVSLTIANSTDSLGKPCRRLEAVAIVSNNTDTELLVLPFVEYDTGWHCAAVEWEKPILAFFVDGVPAGQVTASIPDAKLSTNNRTTYFGTDVFTAAKCFCGLSTISGFTIAQCPIRKSRFSQKKGAVSRSFPRPCFRRPHPPGLSFKMPSAALGAQSLSIAPPVHGRPPGSASSRWTAGLCEISFGE